MSTAAGALALASTLPPAASGALAPVGGAADPGARPFDGLLADTATDVSGSMPIDAGAVASAVEAPAVAPAAPDAAVAVSQAPPPAPPSMDDPATASVLNALALRVATENRTASAAAAGAAGATPPGMPLPIRAGTGADVLPAAVPRADTPAPGPASATVSSVPQAAAAAVAGIAGGAPRGAALAGAGPAAVPLGGLDTAAPDGETASLDALLSTLDGLLPVPSRATPPASAAVAAPAAPTLPQAAPLAAAPQLPMAAATGGAAASRDAPVDALPLDAAGDTPGATSNPSAGSPAAVAAPPFALHAGAASSFAAAAPRADGAQPPIQVPFDSPQWGNELATRVVSLAREQFSEAEIRVTPEELGPIEVKLRFEGERVHAQFGAISPEAREALTANLHRLREMLAGEGLSLGQAFVGHHGQDGARRFDGQAVRNGGPAGDGDDDGMPLAPRITIGARRGLLDEFA